MSAVALLRFTVILILCCRASSIICYFCEGIDNNCVGTTCVGTFCIKRAALVNGVMRTQKMCRNADLQGGFAGSSFVNPGGPSFGNPGGYSTCAPALLWQGTPGTECTCASDYCNAAPSIRQSNVWLMLTIIICIFMARLF